MSITSTFPKTSSEPILPPSLADLASKLSTPNVKLSPAEKQRAANLILQVKLQKAETDAYFWLSQLTQTIDEQDPQNPYKPFPRKKYIEHTIPVLLNEPIVFIPKSRSMMASWTMAGTGAWVCQTRPATGIVVQSRDETRAKKLISYARVLYSRSDPEWQKRHPLAKQLSSQQDTEIRWANNSWMKAITGTADSIRSEHPTIVIFDEAAFMEAFDECFNVGRGAKPLHVWALSSAEKGPFFDVLEDAVPCDWGDVPAPGATGSLTSFLSADVERPCTGLTFGRTDKGWAVVHMHYSADPQRDTAWADHERTKYTSAADWDKEQEINPYAKDGALVYPEFDQRIHVIRHDQIPAKLTRYMAIDPHPRTPHAFLWVGIDRWGDWYFYRELWPSIVYGKPKSVKDTDQENRFKIRDYASTIARLEGNEIEWHHPETSDEYGIYREKPGGERIVRRYMDQAGKGFMVANDGSDSESYSQRYNNFGIACSDPLKQHQAGEDAIREGFRLRNHDIRGVWPKFHISDRCPELILELQRYRYKSMRRFSPDKELSQDGVEARCHQIDLMRYLATADIAPIPTMESPECKK